MTNSPKEHMNTEKTKEEKLREEYKIIEWLLSKILSVQQEAREEGYKEGFEAGLSESRKSFGQRYEEKAL